jgi:hypothetical protein
MLEKEINCRELYGTSSLIQLHGAEHYSRDHQLCSHMKTSQHFMETEGSLPHSQELYTCLYSEPNQSSLYHPSYVALSPQANYTDWATDTCRRNLVSTFVDRGVSRGQRGRSLTAVNLSFLDRRRYFSFKCLHIYSHKGWVDPVSDPLLLRKSGRVGNRTRNLWFSSQKPWILDHRGGHATHSSFPIPTLILSNTNVLVSFLLDLPLITYTLSSSINSCYMPSDLIIVDFNSGKECELWRSSLCSFFQPPATSNLFGPVILLSHLPRK